MFLRPAFQQILSLIGLTLCLLAGTISLALGQGAPDGGFDPSSLDEIAGSAPQVPLTEDMINRLIASHPDMRAAGAKFEQTELPERPPAADSEVSDLDGMPADKRQALEAVATKHGFKDLKEWSAVASSVVMSYTYALQGKKPEALEEAVRLNIAQVERDSTLSEAEKAKTIALYRELGAKLAKLQPLKENVDLVVRMKEKVTPLMEVR